MFLSRAWYQRANKDQSFQAVKQALQCARQALSLSPSDDTIRYNIAMIGHKALEVINDMTNDRRTSAQIQEAIAFAEEAQA